MQNKTERTTISLDSELMQAAQRFAANEGKSFSGLVAMLLRDHLTAHNALPTTEDAERQTVLTQLEEVMPLEEMRQIISQRTAAQAVGGNER
jgi:hypothetical protein